MSLSSKAHSLIHIIKKSPLSFLRFCAILMIQGYRYVISPVIFSLTGPCCRFTPSCSEYALICLKRGDPLPRTLWRVTLRLLKCHPLSKKSGVDLP